MYNRQILNGFLFILAFSACVQGFTQVKSIGEPFITNYQRKDFQAGQQTWMIEESPDGKMFFANNDGLLEYNGHSWQNYPNANKSVIRSILVHENKIYAGGFNEFGYFEADSSAKLTYHSLMNLIPLEHRSFDEIWRIFDIGDKIVFQSYNKLFLFKDGSIEIITAPGTFHFSFFINNQLMLVDLEYGILKYSAGKLISLPGLERLKGLEIWTILSYGNRLLIGTAEKGLFIYDGNSLEEWMSPASTFIKRNQLYSALRINKDFLAFGTIQNGLLICTNDGIPVQIVNRKNGLQNNTILSLKKDRFGNLWIGSDNGIDYLEINSPLSIISYESGISAGYAAVLHQNILYLGTNQGVFYKPWDKLIQGGNNEPFRLIENTQGQVWILQLLDNQLFCGHNKGSYIIKGTIAEMICDVPGGWTFLQPYGHPDKMIGGTYSGLVLYNKTEGQWKFQQKINGFNESSRFLEQDVDGSLWMSHGIKGIFNLFLNESLSKVEKVRFYDSSDGFSSNFGLIVTRIKGEIVFTANDGIYTYQQLNDTFNKNQFLNNIIDIPQLKSIKEDLNGNIWYFTGDNVGVLRYQEDGAYVDISMPFKKLEGTLIGGFEFVYPIDDKNVIFGTGNGFIHYNPQFNKNYQTNFNAYITRITLPYDDQHIYWGHPKPGNQIIPELEFRNNSISFLFSSNDYENNVKTKYATFLEGFDKNWSPWESRFSREFTNLFEGTYTFHVKAKNIYGVETPPVSYTFTIRPPVTRTNLAYFIYTLSAITLIILLVLFIRRRIKRSHENEQKKQLDEFKKKEEKLEREALEAEKEIIRLRNEQLRQKMIMKDKELANSTLEMIQKNKFLNIIKNELKKIKSQSGETETKEHLQALSRKINREINTEKQWEVFETHFENVHEAFLKRLKEKHPDLSPRELKLGAYLRLNISSKEISVLMNISTRGVEISRYRLRKKLGLSRNDNLTEYILSI